MIAGLYEFMDKPEIMELITEGSLFWKGYRYQETVQAGLEALGIVQNTILFKEFTESSLKGALGLLIT